MIYMTGTLIIVEVVKFNDVARFSENGVKWT